MKRRQSSTPAIGVIGLHKERDSPQSFCLAESLDHALEQFQRSFGEGIARLRDDFEPDFRVAHAAVEHLVDLWANVVALLKLVERLLFGSVGGDADVVERWMAFRDHAMEKLACVCEAFALGVCMIGLVLERS